MATSTYSSSKGGIVKSDLATQRMKSAKAINSLTTEKQGYKQNQRKLQMFVVVLSDRAYMFCLIQ